MTGAELLQACLDWFPEGEYRGFWRIATDAVEDLANTWDWGYLWTEEEIIPHFSTGQLTVTSGAAVVGSSQGSWTAAHVGAQLRITAPTASAPEVFQIISVGGPTVVTLDRVWPHGTSVGGGVAVTLQKYWPLPSTVRRLRTVARLDGSAGQYTTLRNPCHWRLEPGSPEEIVFVADPVLGVAYRLGYWRRALPLTGPAALVDLPPHLERALRGRVMVRILGAHTLASELELPRLQAMRKDAREQADTGLMEARQREAQLNPVERRNHRVLF